MGRTTPTKTGNTLNQPFEPTWALVWQEFYRLCDALGDGRRPRRRLAKHELTAAVREKQWDEQ